MSRDGRCGGDLTSKGFPVALPNHIGFTASVNLFVFTKFYDVINLMMDRKTGPLLMFPQESYKKAQYPEVLITKPAAWRRRR